MATNVGDALREENASERKDSPRTRIQAFLLASLAPSSRLKYQEALAIFHSELQELRIDWADASEEEKDWVLAEFGFQYENGESKQLFQTVLSAISRTAPRLRLRVAWKLHDAWTVQTPPRQAPAVPPEAIYAMSALAICIQRPLAGLAIMMCFSGLLRAREALTLRRQDVYVTAGEVTLLLRRTKRGLEQSVCLRNAVVWAWVLARLADMDGDPMTWLIPISYGTLLTWVLRLPVLLGLTSVRLTTHSLRRSGASELHRRGVPLADLLLFGRWLTERAAREYIRKGAVAVQRCLGEQKPEEWRRVTLGSRSCAQSLAVAALLREVSSFSRVTPEAVRKLEVIFPQADASEAMWEGCASREASLGAME